MKGAPAIQAALDAREALASLHLPIEVTAPLTLAGAECLGRPLAELTVGRKTLTVLALPAVREPDAANIVAGSPPGMVVSDRISAEARQILNRASVAWYDRRGHVRLVLPGLAVDTDVVSQLLPPARVIDPFSPAGRDVAIALLIDPDASLTTVAVSARTGRSQGRVSEIMGALRERSLLTEDSRPLIPELFWELTAAWKPRWVPVGSPGAVPPLGYRVGGFVGAHEFGMAVALSPNYPADLYIADEASLRSILRAFGPVQSGGIPQARVAVCPSAYAWRMESPSSPNFIHPLIVALDVAQDMGRGREALENWHPDPEVVHRVW